MDSRIISTYISGFNFINNHVSALRRETQVDIMTHRFNDNVVKEEEARQRGGGIMAEDQPGRPRAHERAAYPRERERHGAH